MSIITDSILNKPICTRPPFSFAVMWNSRHVKYGTAVALGVVALGCIWNIFNNTVRIYAHGEHRQDKDAAKEVLKALGWQVICLTATAAASAILTAAFLPNKQ